MNSLSVWSKSVIWRRLLPALLLLAVLVPFLPAARQAEARVALDLQLRNGRYYDLEAKADQDNKFFLEVRNTGTETVTNIRLSAKAPAGWLVEITPSEILSLRAGNLSTLDVSIHPIGRATKNQSEVIFTAAASEVNQAQSFWITVKAAQYWLWIWIAAGAAVVAVFVIIFLRLNKQG